MMSSTQESECLLFLVFLKKYYDLEKLKLTIL